MKGLKLAYDCGHTTMPKWNIMNFTQIKCFLAVANTLNISSAAKNLFLSQSTVSKNIKKLEEELEVQLIIRTYHEIKLTPSGSFFYNRISKIYTEIQQTISDLKEPVKDNRKDLKIGYTAIAFEDAWLPIAMRLFNKYTEYNLVPIFFDPAQKKDIKDLLNTGTIDFLLLQEDPIYDENINYEGIFEKGFSVVMPLNHPLADKATINIDDLIGEKIILWDSKVNFPANETLKFHLMNNKNIYFKNCYDSTALIAYVRAKLAIGIVPSILYNKDYIDLKYRPLISNIKLSYGIAYSNRLADFNIQKVINIIRKSILTAKERW